jgi:hypothetical protein
MHSFIFTAHLILVSVLNPKYKVKYFETAGWECGWIKEAKGLVEEAYNEMYAGKLPLDETVFADSEVDTDVDTQPVHLTMVSIVLKLIAFQAS